MTHAQAKQIFATHMQAARKRKLAPYETKQLSEARQTLRRHARPAMNSKKVLNKQYGKIGKVKAKANPDQPVLIYGKVTKILATKTQDHICDAECKQAGHRYFHNFTSTAKMYGLPDGSLLIRP